jgi:flagellar biosynthesis/type III secretory pathway protein FliH
MATAVKALEELSQDPEARWMARDREDSAHLYRMGLERSRRDGETDGFERGLGQGRTEGQAAAQRATIAKLSVAFSIEPTEAQRASLDDPNTNLDQIVDVLIRERRWP